MKELLKGLQAIMFAKVRNKRKYTLWECMRKTTKQIGYHYN